MREQEATAVISAPLAQVEALLSDVSTWPAFLVGLESAEQVGHERYRFQLSDGRDQRLVIACVRHDLNRHSFSWKALEGPTYRGRLELVAVDEKHTTVRLALRSHPQSLRAALAEMVLPWMDRADVDLHRLAQLTTARG
jgi:uncharacterized membrane protein